MTALNASARDLLRAYGISQAEWTRRNFVPAFGEPFDGRWLGDACGCPDDRCIGYHHDDPDDCGCLQTLLADNLRPAEVRDPASVPTQPLETEAQARALPAVQVVYAAFDALPPDRKVGGMDEPNRLMLERACRDSGVTLGAYDNRILAWLAGWEPATCAVIAGLITRAYASGRQRPARRDRHPQLSDAERATVIDALDVAAEYRRCRASLTCADCATHPAELCEPHSADLERADEYDALAETLGSQL